MPFSRLTSRTIFVAACFAAGIATLAAKSRAAAPSETVLPATTKGFISTHDVEEVRKKFNETQLGELVADPVMKPFIEDLKQQIGAKLERAGKKLGVKWNDLDGVYGGEVALATIQPNPADKMSHATALIVDITGKRKEADDLLKKIDANQRAMKSGRSAIKIGDVDVTVYSHLAKEGEKPEQTFHFITDELLIATDDKPTITGIIMRLSGKAKDSLASVVSFERTMDQCAKAAGGVQHHVRWFIEPFGYAEVSRAAQGGRKKRGNDILKILQTQGFAATQGIGGHIFFATDGTEVLHRTFAYAPPVKRGPNDKSKDKYDLAMRMLDFPNGPPGALEPQPFTLPDVASYLSFNWKMKDAFDHSETLVDAIVNDKGAFKDIWLNLKTDVNGPMIDVHKDFLDHLATRATVLSDVKLPVDVKSERLMAIVELIQPQGADIVEKTLEKAFKDDPQAKLRVFRGHNIWEITQNEELAEETELMIEGAGFVSTDAPKDKEEKKKADEEAKLPNMALTVFLDHLIVSTHVDFIQDFITFNAMGLPDLSKSPDYQRVQKALVALGSKEDSFHFFSRTDESYRATYELLKQGKLPEAETMLARLLNTMLGPKEDGVIRKQEIDGSKLPEFGLVQQYLGPGGVFAQTVENGWWVVGCLLKKQ